MKHVIRLLRVKQWIKNLFVFLPLFFAGEFLNTTLLMGSLLAFFTFSFTSSIIYILNDHKDIEKDRLHPVKKDRPMANGDISKKNALLLLVPLTLAVVLLSIFNFTFLSIMPLALYFVLNLFYTYILKTIAIIDIAIIATGFVLRVVFGGLVTAIYVSKWALLLTFSLALVLALGKRRGELVSVQSDARPTLNGYNLPFIDTTLTITIAITIVCYIMYTISPDVVDGFGSEYVYATTIFVLLGLLRYLQQTMVFNKTESPTKFVYKDIFIQIMIICWILSFVLIIYFK
jgi:decaprenyl-phosphate phosphoribosyltransferase